MHGFACLTFGWALEALHRYHDWRDQHVREQERRDLGLHIYSYARWFGEDASVMYAMEALGGYIKDQGTLNVSEVRDKWREAVKLKPKAAA